MLFPGFDAQRPALVQLGEGPRIAVVLGLNTTGATKPVAEPIADRDPLSEAACSSLTRFGIRSAQLGHSLWFTEQPLVG